MHFPRRLKLVLTSSENSGVRWLPKDQDHYEWLASAIMVPVVVLVLALVLGLAGLAPLVLATVLLAIGLLRARKPLAAWLRSHVGRRTA